MTAPTCERVWQAEAIDNGSLSGADRASFERHARTCAICSAEQEALAALREAFTSESLPAPMTPLERRRVRAELLRRVIEERMQPPSRPSLPRAWRAALVVASMSAAVASVPRLAGTTRPHVRIVQSQSVDAHAVGGKPEHSGDIVEPSPPPSAQHAAPVTRFTRSTSPRLPTSNGSALFDDGIDSFKAGRYEDADQKLERFAREYPDDRRCEDAAYVRSVARWRLGDAEGAARLARDYLHTYPNGLRRPEAARIADRVAQ